MIVEYAAIRSSSEVLQFCGLVDGSGTAADIIGLHIVLLYFISSLYAVPPVVNISVMFG